MPKIIGHRGRSISFTSSGKGTSNCSIILCTYLAPRWVAWGRSGRGGLIVDTGLPGQDEAIGTPLTDAGIGVRDIKRVIFTNRDLDHIGSGAALVRQSGAQVLAHRADAPHIEGILRPLKPSAEMLERRRPQMSEALERLDPLGVAEHLEDGDRLDIAGGARVIFTPGHLSLYLERPKVLVAADALTAEGVV